jgi:ABC-type transport system involved in multi-copper enzyme maturation permease subunit
VSVVSALPPLNPVLARELKQRMRGRHVWVVVTLYLAILAVILRWVYVAATRGEEFDGVDLLASAGAGRAIFQWLLFFILLLVCFIVPGLTAGAISGERERQTLISLQITLLRARSIVFGKLLASLAFVVLLVVASIPLVTVPFLVGGVSGTEMVKGLVMVLATAVTLACVALACSALLRRTQAATVLSYGITLALVLGTLMVYGAQQIPRRGVGPRPDPWVLALNPFAATADVVEGRSSSSEGFESPFRGLRELLLLDDEDRLSEVITADGSAEVMIGPGGSRVEVFPGRPPGPIAVGPRGPILPPNFPQGGPVGDLNVAVADDVPRLGGMRFWVVSLAVWIVLAGVAVVLAVRRISLPREREA